MNRDNALADLLMLLKGILFHDSLLAELINIIGVSGNEKAFFRELIHNLKVLNTFGPDAVKSQDFESIGDHLFSMKFKKSSYNIRILYGFFPDSTPVLLLAFYERAKKRSTDYSSYVEPALFRLKEMKEERHYGK